MQTGVLMRTEKSVLFIIPWGPHWMIGDTDTAWELDRAHPAATSADIDYVLAKANAMLRVPLVRDDVEGVFVGLRPLVGASDTRRHDAAQPRAHRRDAGPGPDDDRRRQVHDLPGDGAGSRRCRRACARRRRAAVVHRAASRSSAPRATTRAGTSARAWRARPGSASPRVERLLDRYGDRFDDLARTDRRAARARRAARRGRRVPGGRGRLRLHARGRAAARRRARAPHADRVRAARPRHRRRTRDRDADGRRARLGRARGRPPSSPRTRARVAAELRAEALPDDAAALAAVAGRMTAACCSRSTRGRRARAASCSTTSCASSAAARCPSRARSPRPVSSSRSPSGCCARRSRRSRARSSEAGLGLGDVESLSIANQTETFVLWERETGRPIHPAIVWQDRRSAAACEALARGGPRAARARAHRARARRDVPRDEDPLAARSRAGRRAGRRGRRARLRRRRVVAHLPADGRRRPRQRGGQRRALDAARARRDDVGRRPARALRRPARAAARDRRLGRAARHDVRRACSAPSCRSSACSATSRRRSSASAASSRARPRSRSAPAASCSCRPGQAIPAPPDGVLGSPAWRRGGVASFALEGFVPVAGAAVDWLVEIGVLDAASSLDALIAAGGPRRLRGGLRARAAGARHAELARRRARHPDGADARDDACRPRARDGRRHPPPGRRRRRGDRPCDADRRDPARRRASRAAATSSSGSPT